MYQFNPLNDEKKFEELIRDILNEEYKQFAPFDLYGKKGQNQNGNDIIGYSNQKSILAQTKKKDLKRSNLQTELLREIDNEVEKINNHFNTSQIELYIIASTYKRDTILQDKVSKLSIKYKFKILYWGWDTIEDKINKYSNIQNKYFPKKSKYLTNIPNVINFMGRKKELEIIESNFDKYNIFLIQSIGGIGKTTLAIKYLNKIKNFYSYIGFIEIKDDLESALKKSFENLFDFYNDDIDTIIYKLKTRLKEKVFFVIDNLNYNSDFKKLKLFGDNFKILITSRVLFDIEYLTLQTFNKNLAMEFFVTKLSNTKNINSQKIEKILEYLDYHTLFIELTAKSINNNDFTLDYILNEFQSNNLAKLDISIDIDSGEIESFNNYLIKLYNLTILNLKEEYNLLLKKIALLPSFEINIKILNNFLNDEKLLLKLNFLSNKGWLIKNKDNYKIHSIIKNFILQNYQPKFEEINYLIFISLSNVEWDEIKHPAKQKQYLIYISSIIDGLEINNAIATLSNNIAMLYRYFGNYELALKYMKKTLEYDEKFGDEYDLSQSYNNIANVYLKLNMQNEAIEYNNKSFAIRNNMDNYKVGENYLLLCSQYMEIERYDKVEEYFNKLLEMNINEKILIPIFNIGIMLYYNLNKIDEALKYTNIALNFIEDNIVDNQHLYIAYTYGNISLVYKKMNNLNLAIKFKLKSFKVIRKNFGEEYPDFKYVLKDLIYTLLDNNNLKEALKYSFKFIEIVDKHYKDDFNLKVEAYYNLYEIFSNKNNFKKAKVYLEKVIYYLEKDKLNNKDLIIKFNKELEFINEMLFIENIKNIL